MMKKCDICGEDTSIETTLARRDKWGEDCWIGYPALITESDKFGHPECLLVSGDISFTNSESQKNTLDAISEELKKQIK